MQSEPLIYRDQGKTYQSDTCLLLVRANHLGKLQLETWGRYAYPGLRLGADELPNINSVGYWDIRQQQEWGLCRTNVTKR